MIIKVEVCVIRPYTSSLEMNHRFLFWNLLFPSLYDQDFATLNDEGFDYLVFVVKMFEFYYWAEVVGAAFGPLTSCGSCCIEHQLVAAEQAEHPYWPESPRTQKP